VDQDARRESPLAAGETCPTGVGHAPVNQPSRQQELPQDDELLLQDDELLPEQEEEPPQEEPDVEPSQASPAAYQDEPLDTVPPSPAPDAAPAPVLAGHAPSPRPYPDTCQARSSQARCHARRTSQVHSTDVAIAIMATATTTKAVMIASPPPPGQAHRLSGPCPPPRRLQSPLEQAQRFSHRSRHARLALHTARGPRKPRAVRLTCRRPPASGLKGAGE
jgi:hypothetical protein